MAGLYEVEQEHRGEMRERLEAFGKNLETLREERGLSLRKLAYLADMTAEGVSLLERGLSRPRFDTIMRLLWALEVTPNELFGWEEEEKEGKGEFDKLPFA